MSGTVTPFGGLAEAEVVKLAQAAFRLAAWQSRPVDVGDDWETPQQFAESLTGAFESLLADLLEQRGVGFLSPGHGAGVAQAAREVPVDWRPAYRPRGPERSVGRGRSAPGKRGAN
jgi:hypothetical protein